MTAVTKWNQKNYTGGDGVIVASDMKQEWILKWWWVHYSKHNDSPVTFFDLGMSKSAIIWCKSKGTVIPFSLPDSTISKKSDIPPDIQKQWEGSYSKRIWDCRIEWMHKPFIILQSPYDRTIWIDIDCEVKDSLSSLFDYCNTDDGISLIKLNLKANTVINSGVVVAKRLALAFTYWAEAVLEKHHITMSDETALIEAQKKHPIKITPLPFGFNFLNFWKTNSPVSVYHHGGGVGKREILKQIK